jgi:hypothetical protein
VLHSLVRRRLIRNTRQPDIRALRQELQQMIAANAVAAIGRKRNSMRKKEYIQMPLSIGNYKTGALNVHDYVFAT